MAPRLQAVDLHLARGGRPVLEGVSLTLAAGTVTAVTGPSGCGKSTLLRCLNALLVPDGGHVELDGADIAGLEATTVRRRVGLVAQHPTMLAGSVRDNLAHAGGTDLDAALDAAGVEPVLGERDATQLSGGEQARVAIARALTRSPEVLLLDEPTAALDAARSEHLAGTVRALAGDGLAIAIATHDLVWAEAVADATVALAAP